MSLEQLMKTIDKQISDKQAKAAQPQGDRRQGPDPRQVNQPMDQDRRIADRRTIMDRRASRPSGPPKRENYPDFAAYNRAYDRWSESQR